MHQQQTAFKNNVGIEEIARNEQFLLFPQCFLLNQKIISTFVSIYDIMIYMYLFAADFEEPKISIRGKGISLYYTIVSFNDPKKEAFRNKSVKRRKCCKPVFSNFPTMFFTFPKENIYFVVTSNYIICKNCQFVQV